jgi:hypothetical protein
VSGQLLEGLPVDPNVADEEYRAEHRRVFADREMVDMVNNPPHYNQFGIEVIDILELYFPNNPLLFNAGKYLLRSGYKGHEIEDLKKMVFYVQRYIAKKESGDQDTIPDVPSQPRDS